MSGSFDNFAIKNGFVKKEDVQEDYKIRICKDRTLTFTKGKQKPFNGVAITVLSVFSKKEAESLLIFAGTSQYTEHDKMPEKPWLKFFPGNEYGNLEYEDLPRIAEKLKFLLNIIRSKGA